MLKFPFASATLPRTQPDAIDVPRPPIGVQVGRWTVTGLSTFAAKIPLTPVNSVVQNSGSPKAVAVELTRRTKTPFDPTMISSARPSPVTSANSVVMLPEKGDDDAHTSAGPKPFPVDRRTTTPCP